jgi:hypothetical protein
MNTRIGKSRISTARRIILVFANAKKPGHATAVIFVWSADELLSVRTFFQILDGGLWNQLAVYAAHFLWIICLSVAGNVGTRLALNPGNGITLLYGMGQIRNRKRPSVYSPQPTGAPSDEYFTPNGQSRSLGHL